MRDGGPYVRRLFLYSARTSGKGGIGAKRKRFRESVLVKMNTN